MKKTFITQPFLPPFDECVEDLQNIWENKFLTNNGAYHEKFEVELAKFLEVPFVSLVNNATSGLLIALKVLDCNEEVITTPFSFIATSHAIKWNGLEPVFADTDHMIGNLLPSSVEKKINSKTSGILAVHNYGMPGNLDEMDYLSKKYSLPLIYDAAPAMGVKFRNQSLFKYGDVSVISFHATKVFTTFEGGAVISKSQETKIKIDRMRNFGIVDENTVSGLGINAKMNEFSAALGIIQLKYLKAIISKRKAVYDFYAKGLKENKYCNIIKISRDIEYNYAYCPIIFEKGIKARDRAYKALKKKNIFCRKYWFPLITEHDAYSSSKSDELKNALQLSQKILFLPIYPGLEDKTISIILSILNQ